MIDLGQPLGHTVVVGVLCLERELEKTPGGRHEEASRVSAGAGVRPDSPEFRTAFTDQPQANVAVHAGRLRRAKHCTDEVIVEIRGPHDELSLLKCENSVVPPGGLPESGKRHWVLATVVRIG